MGGSKGGVGKSQCCFALTDYLLSSEKKIVLLETDTANPDTYKAHHAYEHAGLVCGSANLDVSDG